MSEQGLEGNSKLNIIVNKNLAAADRAASAPLSAAHNEEATRALLKINKQGTHARVPEPEEVTE